MKSIYTTTTNNDVFCGVTRAFDEREFDDESRAIVESIDDAFDIDAYEFDRIAREYRSRSTFE